MSTQSWFICPISGWHFEEKRGAKYSEDNSNKKYCENAVVHLDLKFVCIRYDIYKGYQCSYKKKEECTLTRGKVCALLGTNTEDTQRKHDQVE